MNFKYLINRVIFLILALLIFTGLIIFFNIIVEDAQILILISILSVLLYLFLLIVFYFWILIPYRETRKILNLFINGYTTQGVFDIKHNISPEIENAIEKLKENFYTHDLINATRKQAQLLALQNQINPHFLYNTLEGIRSEALIAKLNTVADMTEALGNFFRYTISNTEQLVSLEDELINVENYYLIQQYRFGERISLKLVYESDDREKLLKYQLPKLTLQPIVENAIQHGIERKIGKGTIIIKIEATKKRLIITIRDDGLGIPKEQLNNLNKKLNTGTLEYINQEEGSGGIAILNVNNRIKLLFGESYGIDIFSTEGAGTDVEITLPLTSEQTK